MITFNFVQHGIHGSRKTKIPSLNKIGCLVLLNGSLRCMMSHTSPETRLIWCPRSGLIECAVSLRFMRVHQRSRNLSKTWRVNVTGLPRNQNLPEGRFGLSIFPKISTQNSKGMLPNGAQWIDRNGHGTHMTIRVNSLGTPHDGRLITILNGDSYQPQMTILFIRPSLPIRGFLIWEVMKTLFSVFIKKWVLLILYGAEK